MSFGGLNEHHDALVLNYLRFTRFQRSQCVKSIVSSFEDAKDTRLLESTYTIDEIEDVWNDLQSIVSGDVESELIAFSHTNVLLLKQIFEQAQKWHLNLDADLAELENRELLDQVKRWEETQLAKSDGSHQHPPSFLSAPRKSSSKLAPLGDGGQEGGPVQLLRNEIGSLTDENTKLRKRIKDLEIKTTSLLSEKQKNAALTVSVGQVKKSDESDRMRADFEKMKATEVEELTEAFKAVKTQMATELEANVDIKEKLETDLTTTKHSLLDIKHQLNMAEKELEKKFSQTGAYKNLKKMLAQKNQQIKDLRAELKSKKEEDGEEDNDEKSEEEE